LKLPSGVIKHGNRWEIPGKSMEELIRENQQKIRVAMFVFPGKPWYTNLLKPPRPRRVRKPAHFPWRSWPVRRFRRRTWLIAMAICDPLE